MWQSQFGRGIGLSQRAKGTSELPYCLALLLNKVAGRLTSWSMDSWICTDDVRNSSSTGIERYLYSSSEYAAQMVELKVVRVKRMEMGIEFLFGQQL